MNQFPECVVCLQPFDEEDHVPRVITCGHTLCQICVSDLAERWGSQSQSEWKILQCPECSKRTRLPLLGPEKLPKNIELLRLISALKNSNNDSRLERGEIRADIKTHAFTSITCLKDLKLDLWMLPRDAIKLNYGERTETKEDLLFGELTLPKELGQGTYEVSLLKIGITQPGVLEDWECGCYELERLLERDFYKEIEFFLSLSMFCPHFSKVFGIWTSKKGELFLVNRATKKNINNAYEIVKSLNLQEQYTSNSESDVNSEEVLDVIHLFGKGNQKGMLSSARVDVVKFQHVVHISLEICEIFLEIQKAGIVMGLFGPECLFFDEFGHGWFHINGALQLGKKVRDENGVHNTNAQYLSPEVSVIIKATELRLLHCRFSDLQSLVSHKADVWSLGCVLIHLLYGESSLNGLQAFPKVNVKSRLTNSMDKDKKGQCFYHLLERCLDFDPNGRPEVHEIWDALQYLLSVLVLTPEDYCFRATEPETYISTQCDKETVLPNGVPGEVLQVAKESATLEGHLDCVTALAIYEDYLFSASYDKTVRVWSLTQNMCVCVWEGHHQKVLALTVDEILGIALSGDYSGVICAWGITSGFEQRPITSWKEHDDWRYTGVSALTASNDSILYSGSGDRTIKAWSMKDYSLLTILEGHKATISALLVDGEVLYSGDLDGTIRSWWRDDHSPLLTFKSDSSVAFLTVRALKLIPSSGHLVSAHNNGSIQIWKSGEWQGSKEVHDGVVSVMCVKEPWLFTGSWTNCLKAWNANSLLNDSDGEIVKLFESAITSIAINDKKIIVGLATSKIEVLSLGVGRAFLGQDMCCQQFKWCTK